MSEAVVLEHAAQADTDFLMYTGNFYNFDEHSGLREEVVAATGHRTVPVIFDLRDGNVMFIGGFDETNAYLRRISESLQPFLD